MDILTVGAYAGAILGGISLISLVVGPVFKSFYEINRSLVEVSHTLKEINKEIETSKDDRKLIKDTLDRHDRRLDDHDIIHARIMSKLDMEV